MNAFLKCDEEDCDHVETVDAISQELVGKVCPKCGADLLTQMDLDHFNIVKAISDKLTKMSPPEDQEDLTEVMISVHNGKVTIDEDAE